MAHSCYCLYKPRFEPCYRLEYFRATNRAHVYFYFIYRPISLYNYRPTQSYYTASVYNTNLSLEEQLVWVKISKYSQINSQLQFGDCFPLHCERFQIENEPVKSIHVMYLNIHEVHNYHQKKPYTSHNKRLSG